MSKIWWRLTEISPLAEHAMHTPTTDAPLPLIGSTTAAPGLIWDQNDTGVETLRSNGSPVWCDETGRPHTAQALAWTHTANQRSNTYYHAHIDGDLVLLEGRHEGAARSVIDTIRLGVASGHHWLWIDPIGWPFPVGTADHRDEIVPADASWIPAEVEASALEGLSYRAVIAEGYEGADGVLPRFTRQTVAEIIADLDDLNSHPATMPGEFPIVAFDGEVAVISWQQHTLSDERVLEIDRCYPDAEGLYAIGAYQWTWIVTRRR
ncbi:hypothetical protein HDA40_003718 [Hamadaea flava]|uniref:Uncharacterized protein n=1 Tax=Hamadaea flava TaxID=1742688 RepID=A0ABV8LIM5_9ACTN|nr:hypothetical protein [Hamadaea flava]MCP2325211.1 hypothetical protein [Hamadaea flava]